ncbi:MAG: hypothetical protein V4577_27140 [Bacteroidota bacterium]
MHSERLIQYIQIALAEADNLVQSSSSYKEGQEPIKSTKKVLCLLMEAVQNDANSIALRILRAMHDIGMSSYKDFENTPLEDALINVTTILYNDIPEYKNLQPLRMDFGKGNPI